MGTLADEDIFSNILLFTRQKKQAYFKELQKEWSQRVNLQKQSNNKKPHSLFLLVLPKLKYQVLLLRRKKINKHKIHDPSPALLKVTEYGKNCSGTGRCRESGGRDGKINSPQY